MFRSVPEYDVIIAEIGFIALSPHDARRIRRGGVAIWAARRSGGWRLLSVQACQIVSVHLGPPPPDADTLLLSPPITDGRRLRECARAAQQGVWSGRGGVNRSAA